MKQRGDEQRGKLPRKAYSTAQRLGVEFAHKHTASYALIEEAKHPDEKTRRRSAYLAGWGAALAGFKAGYYAGRRSK